MSAAQKRIELRLSGLTMGPHVMDLNRDTKVMTKGKSDVDKNDDFRSDCYENVTEADGWL